MATMSLPSATIMNRITTQTMTSNTISIPPPRAPRVHDGILRVAYQGVPGAYGEAAARRAYRDCNAIPCDQFDDAFRSVEDCLADAAVVPIENSIGGSVHCNYDLLLRHRLHIVGEVVIPVHHCLLALPGVEIHQLTRVISHPQALAQCEHTLTSLGLLNNVTTREPFKNTAASAERISSEGLRDTAAVASARAGELYGLRVLADGIQDEAGNVTRFLKLAGEPAIVIMDVPFKTSVVFADADGERERGASMLFKVLSAFASRDIAVAKIESRPPPPTRVVDEAAKRFEYMFYVDIEASLAEARVQSALREVQDFTSFFRVLGSYPNGMSTSSHSN